MPTYFRFLALLAFKIFAAEQVWYAQFSTSLTSSLYLDFAHVWVLFLMRIGFRFTKSTYAGRCCYFGGWIRRNVWCNNCGMCNTYLKEAVYWETNTALCWDLHAGNPFISVLQLKWVDTASYFRFKHLLCVVSLPLDMITWRFLVSSSIYFKLGDCS